MRQVRHGGARPGRVWRGLAGEEERSISMDEQPIVEEVRDLDEHVPLLAALDECRKHIAFWKDREAKVKDQISKIMGDATVGRVDGKEVLTYRWENRFRASDFRSAYPDTYRSFVHEVTTREFDVEWLKQLRPDLYDEYRVRSLRSSWEG